MRSLRAIALLLATAAVAMASARAEAQWTDRAIDGIPELALSQSAVQVDAAGRPHVFVGGDRVYHYWLDGDSWQSEVVDPVPRSGERLRVALGPSGELHLVYTRNPANPGNPLVPSPFSVPPKERYYATNLSGAWVVEPLPDPPDTSGSTVAYGVDVAGLAVDASHSPHVLVGRTDSGVFHAARAAGAWTFERLDLAAGFGGGVVSSDYGASGELAVDAAGNVHALWFPADSTGREIYSLRLASGWSHEVVPEGAPTYSRNGTLFRDPTALVVEPGGVAHVLLNRVSNPLGGVGRLVQLTRSDAGWAAPEDLGSGVRQMSAALDSLGRLQVLALDASGVVRVFRGASGWERETVADSPYYARVSLGLSAAGEPHGAVLADLLGDSPLVHLFRQNGWGAEEIARSGPVVFRSNFDRVAAEAAFGADVRIGLVGHSRRLLYRDGRALVYASSGRQIRHAVEGVSGFAIETAPLPPGFPFVNADTLALAIEPGGRERAVFDGGSLSESLRSEAGAWSTSPIPGAAALNTRRPALAFDPAGGFHVVFASGGPSTAVLRHVVDAGAWSVPEDVAPVQDSFAIGIPGSIAVSPGPLGSVHVAYLNEVSLVVHATNETGDWVSTVVGNGGISGIATHSLLVEPDGTVHIAFESTQYLHPSLMYGTNRCPPGWYVTEVDPMVVPTPPPNALYVALGSRNPEITLDPTGNPHISYRRAADRSIGYAHVHQSVWQHETVVPDTSSGEATAIAVDDAGVVSIAHHDFWAGDLRLATRTPLAAEPRWDGCPPLPDPNVILDGSYVLDPPPSTELIYEPTESVSGTYGAMKATLSANPQTTTGWISVTGTADVNGDSVRDADLEGIGRIAGKRLGLRVLQAILVRDRDPMQAPNSKLRIFREELIDRESRQRLVLEAVRGKVDGQKVKADRVSQDEVPLSAFAMRLELDISPTGKDDRLAVSGAWQMQGERFSLTGKGSWSPETKRADLQLKGIGGDSRFTMRFSGVRLWRTRSDGVHLRADSLQARALGQKVKVDLTGAY